MSEDAARTFPVLFEQALTAPTAYDQLNALRDAFNQQRWPFDLYLEDNWNDPVPGETHFEYRLRSLDTKDDLGPLGVDVYVNRQDGKGVWHLGDYHYSFWCVHLPDNQNGVSTEFSHPGYATLSVEAVLQFLKTHRVS